MYDYKENIMKYLSVVFAALLTLGLTIVPTRAKAQSFVYTIANPSGPNLVDAYRQDPASGKLTFLASFSTGGLGLATAAVIGVEQNAIIVDGHLL